MLPAAGKNIRLTHLPWTNTTPKWKLKYFENGITLVNDVKNIYLPSIILTLFMHVHIGIMKTSTVPLGKTMMKASFHLLDVI